MVSIGEGRVSGLGHVRKVGTSHAEPLKPHAPHAQIGMATVGEVYVSGIVLRMASGKVGFPGCMASTGVDAIKHTRALSPEGRLPNAPCTPLWPYTMLLHDAPALPQVHILSSKFVTGVNSLGNIVWDER